MWSELRFLKTVLLILIIIVLLWIVFLVSRDQTVDFGGTVSKITRNKNDEIIYEISNFNGEYVISVIADEKTKYILYPNKPISADDISIGDYIDGNYRFFKKNKADNITVVDRTTES